MYFLLLGHFIGSIYGSKNRELETMRNTTRQTKTGYTISIEGLKTGESLERDNKKSDLTTDRIFERWSG